MRIALLSHALPPDNEHGIPRYVYELADALGKRGHSIELISGCPDAGRRKEETENFNINWVHQSESFSKYLPVYGQLKLSYDIRKTLIDLHQEQPFDIVEFPNYRLSGVFSAALGLPKPSPSFISRLSSPGQEFPTSGISPWRLSAFFEQYQMKKLSGFIGHTQENLTKCEILYKLDPNIPKTTILLGLPGGVVPKLHYDKKCSYVGLFLGRIEPRKGFDTLASAWEHVVKIIPDAKLVVAGLDQPWSGGKSFFTHCISKLSPNTVRQIQYLGFINAQTKEYLLKGCDVFIAPSRYESFGLVFLEAMRYGKPVVSCRAGGIPNVVDHGNTGLLVSTENSKELANAIIKLFKDDLLRYELGRNAISYVNQNFLQERVAIETENFYRYLIAGRVGSL